MGLDISHVKTTTKDESISEYFTLDELSENKDFIEKNKHLITSLGDNEGCIVSVIYYSEEGYQREKMNREFINDFENDKLYFDKATVIKAKKYIEPKEGEDKVEIETEFQSTFIDNFVEGQSIFFISW